MTEYKAKLKTVEKWEKDLKVKLSKDLEGDFVTKLTCMLCMKHVDSIKHHKTFTKIWIDGLKSVKKDSIQKHLNGEANKKANELEQKTTRCRGVQRESGERHHNRKRDHKDGRKRPRDFNWLDAKSHDHGFA